MNEEHVAVARQGAGAIAEWWLSHPRARLDLSRANLSQANLSGAILNNADLSGAILREADLRGVNLNDAWLSGASLNEADLSRARLINTEFDEADLSGADLSGTDLRRAQLNWATLSGADLSGANLSGASLSAADLRGADLRGARLIDARLSNANFSDARLNRANLTGADLSESVLTGADFSETAVGYTVFGNVDLSKVLHLESAFHNGPSTIGIDALYKSCGDIPESFLKCCGVPDELIACIPSLFGQRFQNSSVFISYSRADQDFARRLHNALQGRGIRCWLDEHQLSPGDDRYAGGDRRVRLWDKVLLCASESSLTSWWVEDEIATAFDKEDALMKERGENDLALIPLDLDGFLLDGKWESGYAQQVRRRLVTDFRNWKSDHDSFEADVDKLVSALGLSRKSRP